MNPTVPKASRQGYLADVIKATYQTSTFDTQDRHYVPEPYIKGQMKPPAIIGGLVTKDNVTREFKRAPSYIEYEPDDLERVVEWVVESASRLFLITVQCHLQEPDFLLWSMINFLENKFEDKDLPISSPRTNGNDELLPRTAAFAEKFWQDQRYEDFFYFQWTCLVPVFIPEKYDYDLPSHSILPFTRVKETKPRVAIKEITVHQSIDSLKVEEMWDIEAEALRAINLLDHPHIMKSIAAIRRGKHRYFMFPWAQDSLRDYWNTRPNQAPSSELIREAINQLKGLADALHCLHNFRDSRTSPRETFQEFESKIDPADDATPAMDDDDDDADDMNEYKNPLSQESIRHGDIKPENILRFLDRNTKLGTLKLGDMGLAKRHVATTEQRQGTSMRYGTRRYEGPEALNAAQGRSRLYDLWSMGCITFEFIIWLLYGNNALLEFYDQAETSTAPSAFRYYMPPPTGMGLRPTVQPIVIAWMEHMQTHDPELRHDAKSALKDLLHFVREKLLVVELSPARGSALADGNGAHDLAPPFVGNRGKYRATAAELCIALEAIQKNGKDTRYMFTGGDRSDTSLPAPLSPFGQLLDPMALSRRIDSRVGGLSTGVMSRAINLDYSLPPLELWDFAVDNIFAAKVSKHNKSEGYSAPAVENNTLCGRCSKLNFWSPGFAIEDDVEALTKSAAQCDFCKLLADASSGTGRPRSDQVRFVRSQSVIKITGNNFPVLSIVRCPGIVRTPPSLYTTDHRSYLELVTPTAIQIGKPILPTLDGTYSNDFFQLAQEWLKDCDNEHVGCQQQYKHNSPTRLIDVGTSQQPILRLVDTNREAVRDPCYVALSHPWGDTSAYKAFVTLRKDDSGAARDIASFWKAIPYNELPKTFQDAVICTRKLNISYLWIDSICIIQGPDGDFADEVNRMEDVYSGAYCVIAASRARDQRDGFLGARRQRSYVAFQPEKPFYVCQTIDHFNQDVIMSHLNQRGWVLQERALARRTMYFTKNQTYFECGNGVRCETLTKMHNYRADFLGDSSFPDKAMRVKSRALKIEYFQGLYKQYSRLSFSRWHDRPIAIAGLEKRLQRAFNTKGRYGIFDDGNRADGGLFHRSLLWRRAWKEMEKKDGDALEAIDSLTGRDMHVPSWSWMAYKGGIDYTDPPFESAIWETRELIPPWTRGGYDDSNVNEDVAIAAFARDFDLEGRDPEQVKIAYDTEKSSEGQRAQCVLVARSKDARSDQDRRYYVLLVIPTPKRTNDDGKWMKYKRVGAGFMLGKYITLNTPGTEIRIY
ncbi:hypothetical protein ACEQ8H_001877 [Pleosporales sp. CAS-2024a]